MCVNSGLDLICVEEMSLVLKKRNYVDYHPFMTDLGSVHFLLLEVVINYVEESQI